ncbi:delta-lactam-biosynthetic de-N-acetylase [Paenibacillus sp. JX-17]|uniref:Delta-lactam-biosynthetic de-N-acetylase n=1 Tax=Paenibacillus lacisoli TaxID=3064525 RepID=A0ABT9CBY2_9BACL|nr:delta-lactam-biosynthetic de-N-acetylase [Paenibacillus sp. JX-17]MDO7906770.1 delta-lactam-biosynthetic de-N-acetylase [Paenibacillus sp. JX-17]
MRHVRRILPALLAVLLLGAVIYPQHIHAEGAAAYHFGFKKSRNGELPSIAQEGFMDLLQKHGAIFLGDTSQKDLYLTFDNGYENGYTAKVLDVLRDKQVPAAFFVTGHYVETQPELLRRMVKEGHLIGNHSWSHPDMTQISAERIKDELAKVQAEGIRTSGQRTMTYLRPPRGIFNDKVLGVSRELGYTSVFWSVAYKDWDTKAQRGAAYAHQQVMAQLHPGAVILLHSVSSDNAEALGSIIDDARKQGYTFRSLDHLQKRVYR